MAESLAAGDAVRVAAVVQLAGGRLTFGSERVHPVKAFRRP